VQLFLIDLAPQAGLAACYPSFLAVQQVLAASAMRKPW
jgi:hypothetical protein